MTKIFKENSSSHHLRTRYKAVGWISGYGAISLSTVHQVKQKLIEKETLSELGSIRSGIEAQLDFFKQISIVLAIVTFLVSTILNPLTFYLQQSLKSVDWTHQARTEIIENRASDMEPDNHENLIATHLNEEVEEYNKELHKLQEAHNWMLFSILFPMLVVFALLFAKYRWLTSAYTCVNEAFKEKERLETAESSRKEKLRQHRETRLRTG
ncbi:hypothetical protein [Paenibacillus sp. 276b]|uniref:hypothetical protein n=1 Tax=Paenibacillus sp. 276b TaxID=1566277 RepID=UPI0008951321|nr:hypothetical protein [Paenibacillus sp. 276b]SEB27506.1 hypothetical protein SAMN03159332_6167 [Paenibacillus sp. 276b]